MTPEYSERVGRYCALIGSMTYTLQLAQSLLPRCKPRYDCDKRDLALLQESIARALAEQRELFPPHRSS